MDTIFIQLASYRDQQLIFTIENCIEKADNPDKLIFSIHHQYNTEDLFHKDIDKYRNDSRFRIIDNLYSNSKGACWARSITEKQLKDETFSLQVDSHTRFVQSWDSILLEYYDKINDDKAIITGYPPFFEPKDPEEKWGNFVCLNNVVDFNQVSHQKPKVLTTDKDFINGLHINAGFIFAKSDLIRKVPYDPELYFMGEEFNLTIRYFTNGYNFYHINKKICYHFYGKRDGAKRHWDDNPNWGVIQNSSYQRLKQLMDGKDLGIYSLGGERSVDEFIKFTGIDIINKVISPKTKNGDEPPINYSYSDIHNEETAFYDKELLIVVPYRNRLTELIEYIEKVPSKINYTHDIVIVEQFDNEDFNLGAICNTVIKFKPEVSYKWIYISHVDVYPINNVDLPKSINDMYSHLGDYGSFIINYNKFKKIGGFPNGFFGWGGEDNAFYIKAKQIGINIIDKTQTEYDQKHQNHPRKFEAKNYFNSLKLIRYLKDTYEDNIDKIDDTCDVLSLENLKPNIYLQKVKLRKVSPKNYINKNLIITCIFNINEWNKVEAFIKSCITYAGYNYDIVVLHTKCSETVVTEILAHGGLPVKIDEDSPDFVNRFYHYKEYLKNTQYDKVLHLDCTDIYLQDNPFKYIDEKITVANEGVLIKDEPWNKHLHLLHFNEIPDRMVICAGVIGGSRLNFIELCNRIVTYSDKYDHGIDQIFFNRLVNELDIIEYSPNDSFAIHLHTHFKNSKLKININHKDITSTNGKKYAVVHQYNRDSILTEHVNSASRYNNF